MTCSLRPHHPHSDFLNIPSTLLSGGFDVCSFLPWKVLSFCSYVAIPSSRFPFKFPPQGSLPDHPHPFSLYLSVNIADIHMYLLRGPGHNACRSYWPMWMRNSQTQSLPPGVWSNPCRRRLGAQAWLGLSEPRLGMLLPSSQLQHWNFALSNVSSLGAGI